MRASPYKFSLGHRESEAAGLNSKYDRMMRAIKIGRSSRHQRRRERPLKKLPITPCVSQKCDSFEKQNTRSVVGSPPSWLTRILLTLEPGRTSYQLLQTHEGNETSIQSDEHDAELQNIWDDDSIFAYLQPTNHQHNQLLGVEDPPVNKIASAWDDNLCSYTQMSPPPWLFSPVKNCGNLGGSFASAQGRYDQLTNEIALDEKLPYSTPGPTFFNTG